MFLRSETVSRTTAKSSDSGAAAPVLVGFLTQGKTAPVTTGATADGKVDVPVSVPPSDTPSPAQPFRPVFLGGDGGSKTAGTAERAGIYADQYSITSVGATGGVEAPVTTAGRPWWHWLVLGFVAYKVLR
jgi:hypothetical protein